MQRVLFIGGGAIATALGNVLAMQSQIEVTLITIEREVIDTINQLHINRKYFPGIKLCPGLKASGDFYTLGCSYRFHRKAKNTSSVGACKSR